MCGRSLEGEVLGLLPSEVRIVASEVSVGSGLPHDRAAELKVADDASRAEVEVLVDNLSKLGVCLSGGLLGSSVGVNEDGKRVWDANGVGELDKGALAESSVDEGLGDPPGSVGGGAVDLGGVLSGEGSSSVSSPSSVGVDDDLAPGEAGISVGSSDDEASGGVKVVDGLVVEVLGGDDGFDDVLHEVLLDLLVADGLVVLG